MTMTAEHDAKLYEIARAILQLPSGVDVSRARQLTVESWDSLAHVSLMLAIESEFAVAIDIADQIALTSVPSIRLYLEEHARDTAIQLINKTNQFNLNGRRVTEQEVAAVLDAGGRLYAASLSDRSSSHGEILARLVDAERVVRAFVMSCRAFQRRVEQAFFARLAAQPAAPVAMAWAATPRNEPFAHFLRDLIGETPPAEGMVAVSPAVVRDRGSADLDLFDVAPPNASAA